MANSFISGDLYDSGYIGNLAFKGVDATNDAICSILGPRFFDFVITNNGCPSGIVLFNAFRSRQSFCYYFNNSPPEIKKCLTDATVRALVDLYGITKLYNIPGKCCAQYPGRSCTNKSIKSIEYSWKVSLTLSLSFLMMYIGWVKIQKIHRHLVNQLHPSLHIHQKKLPLNAIVSILFWLFQKTLKTFKKIKKSSRFFDRFYLFKMDRYVMKFSSIN